MHLLAATVLETPKEIPARQSDQGSRIVASFSLDDGREATVWGPASWLALRYLQSGQRVYLARDSRDRYHLIEGIMPDYDTEPTLGDNQARARIAKLIRQQAAAYDFTHLHLSIRLGHKLSSDAIAQAAGDLLRQSIRLTES